MSLDAAEIARLRGLLAAATPGPWHWEVNRSSKTVNLVSHGVGRSLEVVMGFIRWGMRGAQPVFNVSGLLKPAAELTEDVPGREHHARWHQRLAHPDAALIVALVNAAPALLDAAARGADAGTLADALAAAVEDEHQNEHGYWLVDRYRQTPMETCLSRCLAARAYRQSRTPLSRET